MKDKSGKEITTKEFFQRWKQGIQEVTPLQQTKISLWGTLLVMIGVIIGLYVTFVSKTWWLFLILLGSFVMTSMTILGSLQKYWALKKIEEVTKGFSMEEQLNQEVKNEQQSTDGT